MSRIVIIECDELMSALLADSLVQAGYAVVACRMDDASPIPSAALVIIDLYMPRQGGLEALRKVSSLYPDSPVIAVSCQFNAGLAQTGETARALGVARAIAKPFQPDALLQAVRAVIGPEDLR